MKTTEVRIQQVIDGSPLSHIRHVLNAYGLWRGHDAALGNYQEELARLPGIYGPPSGGLLIAYAREQPAGCVAFKPQDKGICELKRMFVLPQFRGQKIGKKLLSFAKENALKQGYHTMRLDTHPHMYEAICLYLAAGFVEVGRYNDNPTPGIRFFECVLS